MEKEDETNKEHNSHASDLNHYRQAVGAEGLRLKVLGVESTIEAFLEFLQQQFFVFCTSGYIDSEDGETKHCFVTLVKKPQEINAHE